MSSSKVCPVLEYLDDFFSVVGDDKRVGEAAVWGVVPFDQFSLLCSWGLEKPIDQLW